MRPRPKLMRPRPQNLTSRPYWPRGLNIPAVNCHICDNYVSTVSSAEQLVIIVHHWTKLNDTWLALDQAVHKIQPVAAHLA